MLKKKLFWSLGIQFLLTILITSYTGGAGYPNSSSTTVFKHQQACSSPNASLQYLLYLPKGYETDITRIWPMIVFLHGADRRGDDLSLVTGMGIPFEIEEGRDLPFIVISPQCSFGIWPDSENVAKLYRLINEVAGMYRVDPKRIILTGFSMGGDGTWALATTHPEMFAAIAPVSAFGELGEKAISKLKDTPTWVFHGEYDFVPVGNARRMVRILKKYNGAVKLTVWPGADHPGSCTMTYQSQSLYDWFQLQSRP
jgi:predicted peptidase